MTIAPTSPTGPALGAYANPESLSAEGLLMNCQPQLSGLDTQIQEYFALQRSAVGKKKVVNEMKATMNQYQPPKSEADREAIGTPIEKACIALREMGATAEAEQIEAMVPQFGKTESEVQAEIMKLMKAGKTMQAAAYAIESKAMSKESWQGHILTVEGILQDISGNAELQMIQLQSMVSARQTAVQLTTNMLSKFDQTVAGVVNNIK